MKPLRHYFTPIRPFFYGTLLCYSSAAYTGDISQQRWQFESAQSALQSNDFATFQQLSVNLQDYPLYYYLRYQYLNPRLTQVPASEVYDFLKRYGNSAFGNSLRQTWLNILVSQEDWTGFLQAYAPQKSVALQCYYIQARLATRQSVPEALQEAKELWLTGKSQPPACNVAFDYLYQSPLWSEELGWERIRLAMQKGSLDVVNAVAPRLNATSQYWVSQWQAMHKNPAQELSLFNAPDTPIARDIVLHGIKRLANKQFEEAAYHWNTLQRRYAFSVPQLGEMQRDLALASLETEHPQALMWLATVHKNFIDKSFNEKRIMFALKRQNWRAVEDFITELSGEEANDLRWRYWLARAMEQNGKTVRAQQVYQQLANERDYYGFLAAQRLGTTYQMRNQPITFTPAEQVELLKNLSIAAAFEFYQLGMLNQAKQEWQYAIDNLSPRFQSIAAALAHRKGWHSQAILTATKAGAYDDLEVRFPLAYRSNLSNGAITQGLDLAWVYGIVRQESVFMSDAKSRSGALGLMQLMPATARLVAKREGIKLEGNQDVLDVDTNISLGTSYLRQMLDQFDGNYMLATAAYNAGPGRAKRWAAERSCMPADLWVEMIPFDETRTYVRRVLFYTRVFEERLGQAPRPLRVVLSSDNSCGYTGYGLNDTQQRLGKNPG